MRWSLGYCRQWGDVWVIVDNEVRFGLLQSMRWGLGYCSQWGEVWVIVDNEVRFGLLQSMLTFLPSQAVQAESQLPAVTWWSVQTNGINIITSSSHLIHNLLIYGWVCFSVLQNFISPRKSFQQFSLNLDIFPRPMATSGTFIIPHAIKPHYAYNKKPYIAILGREKLTKIFNIHFARIT